MAFRSQPIIGIQIMDSNLRLAVGRKTESALSLGYLETVSLEGRDPHAILLATLKRLKFRGVHLTLPLNDVQHHFFKLPPLNKRNAVEIVRRELGQATNIDLGQVFFDFTIPVREKREGSYSVLTASKDAVMSTIASIQKAGKKLPLITSCPFALGAAFRWIDSSFQEGIRANLHIDGSTGLISIFDEGDLVFTRSFSLKSKSPLQTRHDEGLSNEDETHDQIYYRVIKETNRSLLFFKQHSHGLMPNSLILSGSILDSEELKAGLEENLGIEINIFNLERGKSFLLYDSAKGVSPEALREYAVPIGLILSDADKSANLVPESIRERGKILWGRLTIATLIISLVIGMGIAHYTLSRQEAILREAIATQQAMRQRMVSVLDRIKKIEANRSRYLRLSRFANSVFHREPFWTLFFQDLSRIIPENIYLEKTKFAGKNPVEKTYQFEITGHIAGNTVKKAQDIYQEFVQQLFSSPYVLRGRFSPPEISPVRLSQRKTTKPDEKSGHLGSIRTKIEDIRAKGAAMNFYLNGMLKTVLNKRDSS